MTTAGAGQTLVVSVVMPTLNQAKFIREAIESVLAQDLAGVELVVVDGMSTDGTIEILRAYGDRIRWVSEKDRNVGEAFNKGVRLARAPLVLTLASDEALEPKALHALVDHQRRTGADVVVGQGWSTDDDGRIVAPIDNAQGIAFEDILTLRQKMPLAFSLFRRELLLAYPMDESVAVCPDFDFWLRVFERHRIEFVPDRIARYRVHAHAWSANPRLARRMFMARADILRGFFGRRPELAHLRREALLNAYVDRFLAHHNAHDPTRAASVLARALVRFPREAQAFRGGYLRSSLLHVLDRDDARLGGPGKVGVFGRWFYGRVLAGRKKPPPRPTRRLVVIVGDPPGLGYEADSIVLPIENLRRLVDEGRVFEHVRRYDDVWVIAAELWQIPRPALTAALVRLLTRAGSHFADMTGDIEHLTVPVLSAHARRHVRDVLSMRRLLRGLDRELAGLEREPRREGKRPWDRGKRPLYLRTDFVFGVRAGGSVAHTAGVLNHLEAFTGRPRFVTLAKLPMVRPDMETHLLVPPAGFFHAVELRSLVANRGFVEQAKALPGPEEPGFLYQRFSPMSYAGIWLARDLDVPFVLEFNGSEVWIQRNWGSGGAWAFESWAKRIEELNLGAADLIVANSAAAGDGLRTRGVDPAKVLVNPNGVDPEVYRPDLDPGPVRARYDLGDRIVVGFIGTFGRWHGVEVLVEAAGRLLRRRPDLRPRLRLLLIGDGNTMDLVRQRVAEWDMASVVVLTGLVDQAQGPAHLAACDILASPTVPTPDGSRFFGSPTKMFEYMAMGRAIVASRLEQMEELLDHGTTAWLVRPGDAEDLARGLEALVDDLKLRQRLGHAARERSVAVHTWRDHTRRIVEALEARLK